jgi:hypothetical protein
MVCKGRPFAERWVRFYKIGSFGRGHEKIRLTARRWIAFAVHEKTRRTDRASTLFNTTGFLA